MKTLVPLAVSVALSTALYFGFPELRADSGQAPSCHLSQSGQDQAPRA